MRIARKWLLAGTLIALLVAGMAFVMPRPRPELSWSGLYARLTSSAKDPSRFGAGQDGQIAPEDSDAPHSAATGEEAAENQKDQTTGDGNQTGGEPSESSEGSESTGGKGSQPASGNDVAKGSEAGKKGANPGNKEDREESGSSESKGQDKQAPGEKSADEKSKSNSKSSKDGQDQKKKSSRDQEADEDSGQSEEDEGGSTRSRPPAASAAPPEEPDGPGLGEGFGKFLKWMIFVVAGVGILYFVFRFRDQVGPLFQSFLGELREFWSRLFQRKQKPVKPALSVPAQSGLPQPRARERSFASFSNPFADGAAGQWPLERLVRFTYEALEAWSREMSVPRSTEQTVLEFAHSLGREHESISMEVRELARMYSELHYSGRLQEDAKVCSLATLWDKLVRLKS